MQATITDIHEMKMGNGHLFQRVTFKLADGSWAKTDLVPDFRNYRHWDGKIARGNVLDGICLKDSKTVDADFQPILLGREEEVVDPQMNLL